MNSQLAVEMLKGIVSAIGIGLAFFVIPFGLLAITRMLPWLVVKVPFIREVMVNKSKEPFDTSRKYKEIYISECHPAQVIKRLKSDGLQSLFRNYGFAQTPIQEPDALCNKDTPKDFLNSANPKPINNKLQDRLNTSLHTDNLPQEKESVNQNGTLPGERKTVMPAKAGIQVGWVQWIPRLHGE